MHKNEVTIPAELAKKLWSRINGMFQFPRRNPEIREVKLVGPLVNPVELAQEETGDVDGDILSPELQHVATWGC